MEHHPPAWLITLLVLQVAFGGALLFLGVSISGSQVRAVDILIYAIPLVFMLGISGLAWWLWMVGNQSLSISLAVAAPIVVLLCLVVLLGVGI